MKRARSERWSYHAFVTGTPFAFALLAVILCVPSLVAFVTQGGSHAAGLSLTCATVLLALLPIMRVRLRYDVLAALLVFLAIHFFVARQIVVTSTVRFAGSCMLIVLMAAAMQYGSRWIATLTPQVLDRAIRWLGLFFLLVAALSAVRLQPLDGGVWEKPTFPFTEPSHFATAFTPVLLALCSRPGWIRRAVWLALGLAVGAALQNLTFLIGVALIVLVTAPLWQLGLVLVAALAAATQIDLTYYLSRLDFSTHTQNLSALVYLQGFDFIEQGLARTWGWGVGFQQLGFTPLHSPASLVIYTLNSGSFLNVQDGGFVGAKAVSELGLFGAAALGVLTIMAIRAALILRRSALNDGWVDPRQRFCMAVIVGYMVDIYVRGVGYFSATTLLLGIAICALGTMRKERSATALTPVLTGCLTRPYPGS